MDQIILSEIKEKVVPILKKAGINRAAVFGSIARGEYTENSDVDILVDLPEHMTLFDVVDLEHKLEEVVGRKVDLVDYEGIKPRLKTYILKDQKQIL